MPASAVSAMGRFEVSKLKMDFSVITKTFQEDDGSLPDINLDFGEQLVAADAYALIQARATHLASRSSYYWSKSKQEECPIIFGQNPAVEILRGEAEPFHVVFGGLSSSSGCPIPDLGVFILEPGFVSLDYRMGSEWNEAAVVGLFELLRDLSGLCEHIQITNKNFLYDPDGEILKAAFNDWLAANPSRQARLP